jgi:hypothetical protein
MTFVNLRGGLRSSFSNQVRFLFKLLFYTLTYLCFLKLTQFFPVCICRFLDEHAFVLLFKL